jgi:hypothetical protein
MAVSRRRLAYLVGLDERDRIPPPVTLPVVRWLKRPDVSRKRTNEPKRQHFEESRARERQTSEARCQGEAARAA